MIVDVVALISLCVVALAVGMATSRQRSAEASIQPARSRHHVGFDGEALDDAAAEQLDRVTIALLRMHSL